MDWLASKFSSSSTTTTQSGPDRSICAQTCSNPCTNHEEYPSNIYNKIKWEKDMKDSVKPHSKHILICSGETGKYEKGKKKIANFQTSYGEKRNKKV